MTPADDTRRRSESSGLDAALRRALDPDPATVDRLVRQALAAPETRPPAFRHWRLAAAAAAVAMLAILALPVLLPTIPVTTDRPPPAPDAGTPISEPALLRISNEHGPVTVTTPAGSKIVFLPPFFHKTDPGDAS